MATDLANGKDPERVRLGRLGALSIHARGRTNTLPARLAWEAGVAAEFGITDDLDDVERRRRMDAALRVRMTRLARSRWSKKKAPPAIGTPGGAVVEEGTTNARRSTS